MHPSAMYYAEKFFSTYTKSHEKIKILEIGSQNVNGTLRDLKPDVADYLGLDFVAGDGVDEVLTDPYCLPCNDNTFDVVLCSSVLEHSDFFWLLTLEMMRVLKPGGLLYINAPSNGYIHRYPVDSWRFYPDAGKSIISWCKRNGMEGVLLESFLGNKNYKTLNQDAWVDFVCVITKGSSDNGKTKRIIDDIENYTNAYMYRDGSLISLNHEIMPYDYKEINHLHVYIDTIKGELDLMRQRFDFVNEKYNKMRNSKVWKLINYFINHKWGV